MHDDFRIDADLGFVYGKKGKPCKQRNPQGYIQVCKRGRYYGVAHRIIWERIHGPIPAGLQINHKNGVKSDNRIANLELVTQSENAKHAYQLGLQRADGVHNGRYKHGRTVGRARRKPTLKAAS